MCQEAFDTPVESIHHQMTNQAESTIARLPERDARALKTVQLLEVDST
jgi:hypothetical protein